MWKYDQVDQLMGELNRFVYTAVYDQICDAACAELKEHRYDLVRLKHERQMRLRVRDDNNPEPRSFLLALQFIAGDRFPI